MKGDCNKKPVSRFGKIRFDTPAQSEAFTRLMDNSGKYRSDGTVIGAKKGP